MADKVVAKYVADVKEYIKEIERATGIAQKEFEKTNTTASGLEGGLKKIGGAVAAAFAVDRIVGFTKEASKLAAQGEGIRKAFERVGDPTLLDGLKQATRGTVTELELMKGAIRASNFKIPLDQLAQLFEFARRRAKETGESVDYLVNSIVMGIGRKSPLILDNLGISAIELRKRFDGISIATANVADVARIVGEIATEEMQKMGTEALTTADRIKQLETAVGDLSEKPSTNRCCFMPICLVLLISKTWRPQNCKRKLHNVILLILSATLNRGIWIWTAQLKSRSRCARG